MVRIPIVNPTAGQGKSTEICKKYTEDGDIVYETRYAGDVSDSIGRFLAEQTGEVRFCGGGFCAAPIASMADGLLDLLIVRRVSRLKFLSLVGAYHDGTHIGADGKPTAAFSAVMQYHKCTSMKISGMKLFCRDGEVSDDTEAEIALLPGVLRVMPAPVIS